VLPEIQPILFNYSDNQQAQIQGVADEVQYYGPVAKLVIIREGNILTK
jgi:hypothetical protein